MPKVRGSFAGTEISSEKPSPWHERFAGHVEQDMMEAGGPSSKLWIVIDFQHVEGASRGLAGDLQAARSYSWMMPPSMSRRQISPVRGWSWRGSGVASRRPRCGRDSL